MNARAILTAVVALLLGLSVPTRAQDTGEEKPSAKEEQKPRRTPPTAGALPYEDPTIQPKRDENLQVEEAPTDEQQEEEESEADAGEVPTGTALPVEDPTIHQPIRPVDEPRELEPSEDDRDWGQPVKVAYDYQGGLLVGVDDWFYLALAGLVQARYSVNYRTKPPTDPMTMEREKQVTQGFDVARARFQLGIGLTEFVSLYMRIGVVAGGNFSFQRAFIDLKWKFLRLRAGLFMNETIAESLINPNDLDFLDYSIVENVYTPGSSKGVMFTYLRRRFSINLGYSDGLRTGFSEIRSSANADFAVTLRVQYAWGEAGLSGFNRLVSRRGTPFGVRLGGALHYQDGGRSQGSLPAKIALGTIDVSARGSGWSLLFSATAGQDATVATATNEAGEIVSAGISVMGSYFVLENLHVFGQYSIVTKPRIQGELPPTVPDELEGAPSNFQAFGVGFSFFVVPHHDNVKLSSDFQYFLGRERGSVVPASALNSIQPNTEGSQFAWRIQLSAAF